MIKSKPISLFLLILMLFSLIMAQEEAGIMILGLAVQGHKTISESSIKIQSGLVEGRRVTQEDIAQAIQRLWKLKMFSDIQILLDKETSEGVFLVIKVEEYLRLEKFEVKGNKKIKKSKIEEELNLVPGRVLSANLIAEVKRKVKALYTKEGYLLAQVDAEITDGTKENSKNLILKIQEGKKKFGLMKSTLSAMSIFRIVVYVG